MKQTVLAAMLIGLGCGVAMAETDAPQQPAAQAPGGRGEVITVIGCVLPDEGGAAEAIDTPGVTGSRANTTYVLTNVIVGAATSGPAPRAQTAAGRGAATAAAAQPAGATPQPSAGQGGTATRAPARPSAPYTLEGHDMTEYAGQQVEVTGTVATDTSGTRPRQSGGQAASGGEPAGKWVRVATVRRIAATCPAQR